MEEKSDGITLELLMKISRQLRENTVRPSAITAMNDDGIYLMMPHADFLRDLFWKPPARRSASARKRKAARKWRK